MLSCTATGWRELLRRLETLPLKHGLGQHRQPHVRSPALHQQPDEDPLLQLDLQRGVNDLTADRQPGLAILPRGQYARFQYLPGPQLQGFCAGGWLRLNLNGKR